MVKEGDSRGHSGGKVTAMCRQADRADQQRNCKGPRRGLVFESQYRRTGDQRSQRADRSYQQRGSEGESERFGHQQKSPYADRAGGDLLGAEHFAEARARDGAERPGRFVVKREGDVGVLYQNVIAQNRGVAQVFEDGNVDLAVLLQPGVPRELKEGHERERHAEGSGRERFHFAGVFSNCCLAQTRLGLSSSDLTKA